MDESSEMFPVLSLAKVKKPTETDRRLPSWLSHPTQFPAVNLVESGQDIDELSDYIDEELRNHLKKTMLIERMFPVQRCLIPSLSKQFRSRPYRRPNDICVSSPTGSGKTLGFAIPIVSYLKRTLSKSLRALIVLPSRDLARQVFKTVEQLCTPTLLNCALADGTHNDAAFFKSKNRCDEDSKSKQCLMFDQLYSDSTSEEEFTSLIDILVATPGVLVDLIHNSPGFSLRDLEILVIDEADRLMTSHKHDWLNTLERSIFSNLPSCPCEDNTSTTPLESLHHIKRQRTSFSSINGCALEHSYESKPLHKLLFSATLSSDPQILMHMNLFQPRLFLATRPSITSTKIRHSLGGSQTSTPVSSPAPSTINTINTRSELLTSTAIPEQLEEKMFITEAKEKLFIMWYLLHELGYKKVICFTNQLQTAARLCKFINEIQDVRAVEFSSHCSTEQRLKFLQEFRNDRIDVLVSTDLMARGMDVEGVEFVISYDMPSSEIFYVHRVGRTARAGKKGTAITLVDTKQLVQFKKIVQLAHKMPNSMRLSDVVEEMKVPQNIKKNPEKYDVYSNTLENYEDKISGSARRNSRHFRKAK